MDVRLSSVSRVHVSFGRRGGNETAMRGTPLLRQVRPDTESALLRGGSSLR